MTFGLNAKQIARHESSTNEGDNIFLWLIKCQFCPCPSRRQTQVTVS